MDKDTGLECRLRRDDQWKVMIQEKWNERMATICVEVVNKPGYEMNEKSVAGSSRSGVTNAGVSNASSAAPNAEGIGETCCKDHRGVRP